MPSLISEQDALDVMGLYDHLAPERQPEAKRFLERYRSQQLNDLGETLFPSLAKQEDEETRKFRSVFDDVKNVDAVSPSMGAIAPFLTDPAEGRARTANVMFLARKLGKSEEETNHSYPFYSRAFAKQHWHEDADLTDMAFYQRAAKEVQLEKAAEDAANEAARAGTRAALTLADASPMAAIKQAGESNYSGDEVNAFLRGYNATQSRFAPHRTMTRQLFDAVERSMKGGAKPSDAAEIDRARETIIDLVPAQRRAVLQALVMAGKTAGDATDKSGVLGWFQQAGEAGGRFLVGMTRNSAAAVQAIHEIPDTGTINSRIVKGIANAEDARAFVLEQITGDLARRADEQGPEPLLSPRYAGEPIKLTPEASALVKQAKERAEREVQVARELRSIAESSDPVNSVTASALGTSITALGITALSRGGSLPAMASGYAGIEYDELSRKYSDMSHEAKQAVSGLSGDVQAAMDAIGFKALDRLPGLKSILQEGVSRTLLKRAGIRMLGTQLTETGVEIGQDFATPLIQETLSALKSDVPGVDWDQEVSFWQDAKQNFVAMLPLTLLGVGFASVKEYAGAKEMLSDNATLGEAGLSEEDRLRVIDLARAGKVDESQAALQEAWGRRSPEVAQEFSAENEAQKIELSRALDTLTERGIVPRIQRNGEDWTVTDHEGHAVTVQSREQAMQLVNEHVSGNERARVDAITEAFDMLASPGDTLDFDNARTQTVEAGKADALGKWTEEQATQAVIAHGVLDGMTEEDARGQAFAVLGANRVEQAERVREGVATIANVSRSELNQGASVLTAIEEPIHGIWTRGLREGHFTQEEGLAWVRMAERVTGEKFLAGTDAEILAQPESRALNEGIAALVIADAVGRRKDGSRMLSGVVSRGLTAELQNAKDADKGSVGKLRQFLRAWRELFAQVLSRARSLARAHKEGTLGASHDEFLDRLLGTNEQERHERAVAQEASRINASLEHGVAEDATLPALPPLVEEEGSYTPPTAEQEAAGIMFSITPRQLLDRVSASLASKIKSPEQREAFFTLAKERLQALREDSLTWRHDVVEGLDSKADRMRTAQSLENERKFRFRDRQRALIEQGMASLSRETVDALYSDEALHDARENPLIAEMLVRDSKAFGGWRGRLARATHERDMVADQYDDMPEGLPRWMFGGSMRPDQMAKELYENGLITSPDTGAMWKAIGQAFNSADHFKEQFQKAREAVRQIEHDAKVQARKEADAWHEQAKSNAPTAYDKMMSSLRAMDAIASAFPAEIRGRVGGITKLASLKTDKARLNHMLGKINALDGALEGQMRKDYRKRIDDLIEKHRPQTADSRRVSNKLTTADEAETFQYVADFLKKSDAEQAAEIAALEVLMQDSTDTEAQADALAKYGLATMFQQIEDQPAASLSDALEFMEEDVATGRLKRAVLDDARKQTLDDLRKSARDGASKGRAIDKADVQIREALDSKGIRAVLQNIKGMLDSVLWTTYQQMEITYGEDSEVVHHFGRRLFEAHNASEDMKLELERSRHESASRIFGTKSRIKIIGKLAALRSKIMDTGVIIRTGEAKAQERVPVDKARGAVEGTLDLGYSPAELRTLKQLLAENDARPESLTKAERDALAAEKKRKGDTSPIELRRDVLQFERTTNEGRERTLPMSQLEGVYYLQGWAQPDVQKHMEKHGWSETSIHQLEAFVSPEAHAVARWMADWYAKGHGIIDPVHRRMYHAPLPRNPRYAPAYYKTANADSITPLELQAMSSGMASGFTKQRVKHGADLRQMDALTVFLAHWESVNHWVHYAEIVRDMRAVMRDTSVQEAVIASHGAKRAALMDKRIAAIESRGQDRVIALHDVEGFWNRLNQFRVFKGLAYRLSPIVKQTSAVLNPMLHDIPADAFAKGLGKLLAGKLEVSRMWESPAIQRRVQNGYSPEIRLAMSNYGVRESQVVGIMQRGLLPMNWTDAAWNTLGAAIAYDYYRGNALTAGASEGAAHAEAMKMMERMVYMTAQPVDFANRSLVENTSSPFMKSLWMFASETRKTLAIEAMAARRLLTGTSKNKLMDAQRLVVAHFIMGAVTQLCASVFRSLATDDDDDAWTANTWAAALLAGPINGLWVFGQGVDYLIRSIVGARSFPDDSNLSGKAVHDVISGGKNIDDLFSGDPDKAVREIDRLGNGVGAILSGAGMPAGGAVGVGTGILKQIEEAIPDD